MNLVAIGAGMSYTGQGLNTYCQLLALHAQLTNPEITPVVVGLPEEIRKSLYWRMLG